MATPHPLVEQAQAWQSKLDAYNSYFELHRQMPDELAKAFAQAGFFHSLVPTEYGGSEAHPWVFVEFLETLAKGNGSAAWSAMIGATTGAISARLPDQYAREIFGSAPGVITCGVTAPMGKAVLVEGGYEVTGRWTFGSGSPNADWIIGGCFIHDEQGIQLDQNDDPQLVLLPFQRDDVKIHDTWHTMGMRGSGSHDFEVNKVFVPMARKATLDGPANVNRALYQFPLLSLLAFGVCAVSLGIASHALEYFIAFSKTKVAAAGRRSIDHKGTVQANVGECVAALDSARAYLKSSIDSAWLNAQAGESFSLETRAKLRNAAAWATKQSAEVVSTIYRDGGGSALYEKSPLQQCFRDVHVSTQHHMVSHNVFEITGRVFLGAKPNSPL